MHLSEKRVEELQKLAREVRVDIIEMLSEAKSGHSGGPLGMADVFVTLFFELLNIDPKNPGMADRDRFVLSNGHIAPVMYATMARGGFFPLSELKTLRKLNTNLQGHPHRKSLPGLETTSGPLGSGLSQASGMALVAKMDNLKWRVVVAMSDGEQDEGNTWEAAMFAGNYKLNNLTAIMDRNNIQIDGFTDKIMDIDPIRQKYEAFKWNVLVIDGHDFQQIAMAYEEAKTSHSGPTLIVANTIPGKGVSYMENDYRWHGVPPGIQDMEGVPPKEKQVEIALKDLKQ